MKEGFFSFQDSSIKYVQLGHGAEWIIALHGFGQSSTIFNNWFPTLSSRFTLFAIDLPYHGQTQWKEAQFSPTELVAMLQKIIHSYQITQAHLVGHSFGGRLALSIFAQYRLPLQSLMLLAPDGIHTKGMQIPQLIPPFFKKILVPLIQRPAIIIKTAQFLHRLGMLDRYSIRFLSQQLSEPQKNSRACNTWLQMHHFTISFAQLKKVQAQSPIPILIILGQKDVLIDIQKISNKVEQIPATRIQVLDCGHELVHSKVARVILEDES